MGQILSLDTETTGLDIRHGARAFFITTCTPEGKQWFTDPTWDVNPVTREVTPDWEQVEYLKELIRDCDTLVMQNGKFDALVLEQLGVEIPWEKTEDTLIASHVLASGMKHDLTSLGEQYLFTSIKKYEVRLDVAVKKARDIARRHYKTWRIAKDDLPELPSGGGKDSIGKADMWLPKALLNQWRKEGKEIPQEYLFWDTALEEYSNADSAVTAGLWPVMKAELERRGIMGYYRHKMKLVPIFRAIEDYGMTGSVKNLTEIRTQYEEESAEALMICQNIAESYPVDCPECEEPRKKGAPPLLICGTCGGKKTIGYPLEMPKSTVNGSLRTFMLDHLKLPVMKTTEKGNPSMDAQATEMWLGTLPKTSKAHAFIEAMAGKRKRDTAITYMRGYERFWFLEGDYFRLHPVINLTGTATTRKSSQNPNEQNISKKEDFNLRYAFGPAPGREWWSLDAQNLELRIPAYEANEQVMLPLFESPKEPPFYGSNHLLNFSIVYPEIWEKELPAQIKNKDHIKDKYRSTNYQWCKNGGFAKQYGAQRTLTDATFRREGAFDALDSRFVGLTDLTRKQIAHADRHGYVETIPDRDYNPKHGYPLMCARSEYGKVIPTIPLSYHVQGTAGWWMCKANVRVHEQLQDWNKWVLQKHYTFQMNKNRVKEILKEKGYHIIADVHDELVFDFPKRADPRVNKKASNLGRIREVQRLMVMGGDDFVPKVPTPVSIEWHPENWSQGVRL